MTEFAFLFTISVIITKHLRLFKKDLRESLIIFFITYLDLFQFCDPNRIFTILSIISGKS